LGTIIIQFRHAGDVISKEQRFHRAFEASDFDATDGLNGLDVTDKWLNI
jgi:hypothetical protein